MAGSGQFQNLSNLLFLFVWSLVQLTYGKPPHESEKWTLVQNGTTGIVVIELMVVSPTLALMFQRAANDPLMINNHSAWGALWNFETNTATPLDLITNAFCGSGGFLSNGTMISVGGNPVENHTNTPAQDGRMGLRRFEPCLIPDGTGCTIFDDPSVLHIVEQRWYPSTLRIFDGSLMVLGGDNFLTPFYNLAPNARNNYEFVPPKDGGVPRPSPFLERTMPANMFPRAFALPDGKLVILANNQTVIYDIETDSETVLPEIPNGVRVSNPFDGTATLLPLSPPDYIPEVFVCGGSNVSDTKQTAELSKQDPASDQCGRMVLTPEGIKKGWQLETMLEGRIMPEMILLPNGEVIIVNGAQTGYPATGSVQGAVSEGSNADHPALTPVLYSPHEPHGHRFSNKQMPTSDIPRLYHSTATLTPMGNIMLAGHNPHPIVNNDTEYPTEFRVEYLNPPYMSKARPVLGKLPARIDYNTEVTVPITVPALLRTDKIQVALMDLGFSTHAFHQSSRLVWMVANLSKDRKLLNFKTPPNNRVYPPGPGFVYITIDNVFSEGVMTLIGNGQPPPVEDQGVPL